MATMATKVEVCACCMYVYVYIVYMCMYVCMYMSVYMPVCVGGTGDWVRYGGGGECRGCLRLRYVVMCVRVHVPVCFYMRVSMHIYIYICIYMCVYICMHGTSVCTYLYVCMYVYVCVYECVWNEELRGRERIVGMGRGYMCIYLFYLFILRLFYFRMTMLVKGGMLTSLLDRGKLS